ncbi:MAG: AAA family ATPase [Muribaculaceae bacterium]|nr:AAA family ATPase [Muribaculaceae bacterium]
MQYPIGIQSFEKLREGGYVYIDKTALLYKLARIGQYVFLSRPRRFGKSLILSTLEAYFEGRKELFEGLAMAELEKEWAEYPVLHIDLNKGPFTSVENLRLHLIAQISKLEERYGRKESDVMISDRFSGVIERAVEKTGCKVVVLIDEYDKPLLEVIDKPELLETMRDELRGFYSVLKSCDRYIRFAMLTGVTKFGQLSVFSGLNNIKDISFRPDYSALCGITESEMLSYFGEPIQAMAANDSCSAEEMVEKLRNMYDGYRFTSENTLVYNPFSLLNAFDDKALGAYWFATGTPNYLVKLLRRNHYDIADLEGVTADVDRLSNMDPESTDPIPAIYQSGYLTIKSYDREYNAFTLGFPNEEVRIGLMKYLLPVYVDDYTAIDRFDYRKFATEIKQGRADDFMRRLQALTASISYEILANCEKDFQNLLFVVFSLTGVHPAVERRTSNGRIDMVIETAKYVYVMEYKVDSTAQNAMDQINSKQYSLSWTADSRQVIKIGASFSTAERRLTDYLIEA